MADPNTARELSETRLRAAEAIAREAGALARRRFVDASFEVRFKGPQDYLTEVDGETEDLIAAGVKHIFPLDGFVGEERDPRRAQEGGAVWVVDPIDGTANFARGVPYFCVSIACVADGGIEAGVIYDPMRDELFAARRGGGARLNGAPMSASPAETLANSTVEVGWNSRAGATKYLDLLRRIVLQGASPFRTGSGRSELLMSPRGDATRTLSIT